MRMAAASWMWKIRDRGLRSTRNRSEEDEVQLDLSKVCPENVHEILSNICKRQGITEGKKLGYLNAFVKLLIKNKNDLSPSGYTVEEILYCLRPALANESTQVRAGCLRALRYFLQTKQDAAICMKLQYPILIARSLDLNLMNDTERIQALRVIRHLLCLNTVDFPVSLMRAIVALPAGCGDERLLNAALGMLAEICVLNPELFILCGGATAVLRNLSCVRSARMSEALIGILLYLLNKPDTRQKAMINLDCLAAPYTDLHTVDKIKDMVQSSDTRLKWPHVTLLSMLRSWPGVLHFCHPERESLRSIVATLYLNQMGVRKAVLDLLYELLCLAQPEWSDEMSVALEAVDPSRSQDSFRLSEGFVAAEGKAVLPHLSKCRVNLTELHLSLLLYCFLEAGLLDGIVEVIVSEDTFLSVRATILLGELLYLIHLLLPPECCNLTPALPNLLSYAVRGRPATCQKTPFSKHVDEPVVSRHTSPAKDDSKRNSYVLEDKRKKDCMPQNRLSVHSGHSSVRTVSESSTDKMIKVEKNNVYETTTAVDNVDLKDGADGEVRGQPEVQSNYLRSEQTTNLLHDVREALSDLTNTFNGKSQKQDQTKYKSSYTSTDDSSEVDVPYSCRSQQRALAAVSALSRLHRLLRKRPAPASIFLDHVLTSVDRKEPMDGTELAKVKGKTYGKNKVVQVLTKECEEAIKESGVLNVKDPFAWNWDIIRSVLKSRPECLRKAEDHNQKMFLRRLVQFIAPTARQFSRIELGADRRTVNTFTLSACELIDCLLLGPEESECEKLLMELLEVMKSEFESISTAKSAHDCLLSPQNVMNSLCQDYFLLVGHLTRSEDGRKALEKSGIFKILLHLAVSTNHDCYVKLTISSLDYSSESMTREIMSGTLSCKHTASRLYATRFLRVLLRTPLRKHPNYAAWVIELLVNQLHDENKAISLAAINALDEACDCKEYLEAMINLRPSLLHLGDRGLLLLVRFLSVAEGYSYLSEVNFVPNQLQKWAANYNYKYVCIVEGELCDALSLYEKNEDGRYSSRLSNAKLAPGDVYVAPHLYGQLSQHEAGFSTLMCDENIPRLMQVVFMAPCSTDNEILELKAAVWALGHISSSVYGAQWARQQGITKALVNLTQKCPVYSVRATAFYALALTATNSEGADTLRTLGWHTVRHNRHDRWPVVTPLSLLEEAFFQYEEERSANRNSVGSFDGHNESVTKSGLFFLPEDIAGESEDSLSGFPVHEKTAREQKAATLPPTGITPTYHHNRSYSESKADSDWSHVSSSGQSNSGMDIHELSDRLIQNLSPIPSSGSLVTVKSNRRGSVSSNYSTQGLCLSSQLSHQDALGYATLRSLYKGRRPFLSPSPNLSLPLTTPGMQLNLSPLSPIELIAFQDWRQMSPLARPKHSENQPLCSEFEARGIRWPLFSDSSVKRTLHYESSRSCITKSPDDLQDEETVNSGPCYLGICLPQRLVDLFPDEEDIQKSEILLSDNNADSTAGMDISSCDSETDTAPDIREAGDTERPYIKEGKTVLKRRHDRNNCLLCSVSRYTNSKQPRWRKISASSVHRIRTETESSYGGIGNDGESPVMLPWQTKGGLEGINSADSSSTDMTSLAQRSLGDTFKSRSVVRREIVHLTEQLANPVLYKTCKQALLHLKQMYGDIFHDVCVYSDVSSIMANTPLRIQARRFLQELFLDAPFCELYEEPLAILNLQPTTDNDETSQCVEKGTTNLGESLNNEDSVPTQDSLNWKTGMKPNVYDTEQRTNQGYELEVIIETDARSESSDMCKLGSSEEKHKDHISAAGSHDSFGRQDIEIKKDIQKFASIEIPVNNEHSENVTNVVLEEPKEDKTPQAKVLKSRQQLREEFFASTVCSKKDDDNNKNHEERSAENISSIKTTPKIEIIDENLVKEKVTEHPKGTLSLCIGKQGVSKQIPEDKKADNRTVTKKTSSKVSSKTAKSDESTKESVVTSSEKIESKKPKTIENSGGSKTETPGSRQRKKATAKVPNRESLDVSRNRKDSMSKEEKEEKRKSRS